MSLTFSIYFYIFLGGDTAKWIISISHFSIKIQGVRLRYDDGAERRHRNGVEQKGHYHLYNIDKHLFKSEAQGRPNEPFGEAVGRQSLFLMPRGSPRRVQLGAALKSTTDQIWKK